MGLGRKLTLTAKTGVTATYTSPSGRVIKPFRKVTLRLSCTNNSGTLPTLDVKVQNCPTDSATSGEWLDVASFVQQTNGSGVVVEIQYTELVANFYPFFRAVCTLAGTSPNYDITVDVWYD